MKKYYRSIEEYKEIIRSKNGGKLPVKEPEPEFSTEGLSEDEKTGRSTRRDFLKILGFTASYAALASSCEMPVRKAIPYLNQPEEVKPGIANFYASSYYDGHEYCSILVKTREGRPIKIEGNNLSAVTKGGTSARVQASVLSLYDTARLQGPMKDKSGIEWETVDDEIVSKLNEIRVAGGNITLLTNTVISPSTKKAIEGFISAYPGTEWIQYDNISYSAIDDANEANFGLRAIPSYHFDKAEVIVGFNADFLGNWLSPVEYTKQYSRSRSLMNGNDVLSKHIQYESYMSLTGSNADARVSIRPSDELVVLLNLYNELAGEAQMEKVQVRKSPVDVIAVAEELKEHMGRSLVVSGTNDFHIQSTVNAINYLLGNYGETIDLNNTFNLYKGDDQEMEQLTLRMESGDVDALICYGVNPVYDFVSAKRFTGGMKNVGLTVSFSPVMDETASLCQYVLPDNHYLESWNDAEPKKNHFSLYQPTIPKIFNTRQAQQSMLIWGGSKKDYLGFMKSFWKENIFTQQNLISSFDHFWNQCVHDGIYALPAEEQVQPAFAPQDLTEGNTATHDGWELVIYEKMSLGDGRNANNPWLQEMPDPISSAVWDNYVCIAPSDAEELGLKNEDVVLVDGDIKLPVYVQPGQAKRTIGIACGYGRTSAGRVADGIGKNVFHLQEVKNGYRQLAGKKISFEQVAGETYPLALTQVHNTMEGRAIVRETTLEEWKKDPKSGNEMHKDILELNLSLYEVPDFDGYHWGMAINLNACTGCGACVIACQAENNVAVIGKEEVKNRRIMHWIRIDRYYSDEADNPEVTHMPVMCQHCDNAPCENVCPVAATPHSNEGLNMMAYNRCIGTRYCMNNCPYKVRRFNWFEYSDNEEFPYNFSNEQEKLVLNPDVTVRSRGVVEKCSLCTQRIQDVKLKAKLENRTIREGELKTACQQACPGDAIVFGDMNDKNSEISKLLVNPRTYQLLEQLHTLPSVSYVTKVRNIDPEEKARNYKKYYPVGTQFEGEIKKGGHGHGHGGH